MEELVDALNEYNKRNKKITGKIAVSVFGDGSCSLDEYDDSMEYKPMNQFFTIKECVVWLNCN